MSLPAGRLRRLGVLLLWLASLALVVAATLKPHFRVAPPSSDVDKVYHFLAYCWLAGLALVGWGGRWAVVLALLLVPLGGGLEWLQGFVPGRTASTLDFLANSLGICAGFALHGVRQGLAEGRAHAARKARGES